MTLGLAKFGDSWEQGRGVMIKFICTKKCVRVIWITSIWDNEYYCPQYLYTIYILANFACSNIT